MNDLTKPLGIRHKKKTSLITRQNVFKGLERIPYVLISVGLLSSLFILSIIWMLIVDNPTGGEPFVTVRILEPKFDSEDREVGLVAITDPVAVNAPVSIKPLDIEGAELTEIGSTEDIQPGIDPDEILIYDPTKESQVSSSLSLSNVADKGLIEKSRYGFLPRIGDNGEKPLAVYSRPSSRSGGRKSRVAIIVGGVGLNNETTARALSDLPPEITLAFVPYANNLFDWMAKARKRGHELLLQLPLEPFDYPNNDPGPKTLLVDAPWEKNLDNLYWLLSRMTNYVGVVNFMGARFSASPEALRPLFAALRERGLLYVDNGETPLSRAFEISQTTKLPFSQSSIVLDSLLNADDIDTRLLELESLAREKGLAIGIASAFPVTLNRLKRWAKDAEKRGVRLIPVSATLNKL